MFNLFKFEFLSRCGAIFGWGIGLALFGAMYIGLLPEVGAAMESIKDLSIYQAMGIELGSSAGYLASTVVQFSPIILGIFAIISGTAILAGEEDNGTLELVLASPLRRWQIVSMKALALGIVLVFMLLISAAGSILVLNSIDMDIDVAAPDLLVAILNGWPITMAFTMISLWLGSYLPSRRIASLVATVVFIASYFGEMAVNMVESLEPLRKLSLFSYFDSTQTVFTDGVQTSDLLTLIGVALLFFVLALLSFQRRNITVGAWPWQKGRV